MRCGVEASALQAVVAADAGVAVAIAVDVGEAKRRRVVAIDVAAVVAPRGANDRVPEAGAAVGRLRRRRRQRATQAGARLDADVGTAIAVDVVELEGSPGTDLRESLRVAPRGAGDTAREIGTKETTHAVGPAGAGIGAAVAVDVTHPQRAVVARQVEAFVVGETIAALVGQKARARRARAQQALTRTRAQVVLAVAVDVGEAQRRAVALVGPAAGVGERRPLDGRGKWSRRRREAADACVGAGTDIGAAVAVDVAHAHRLGVRQVAPAVGVCKERERHLPSAAGELAGESRRIAQARVRQAVAVDVARRAAGALAGAE